MRRGASLPVRASLLAGALLAAAALAAGASPRPQPAFDSWTTENGLPQNSVNDILQTRDGYL